jgi:peptidyl-prolyl cis-trans isomerase C
MSTRSKSIAVLGFFLGCFQAGLAAESGTPAKQRLPIPKPIFGDKVVAKGKGFEITQSQVDDLFLNFKARRAANGVRVLESMRPQVEVNILETMIATQLFLQKATNADRTNAIKAADEFIAQQAKQSVSEEAFNRQLVAMGMTSEQYHAQVLEQATVKAVIDREIKSKKSVSDAEVKAYFDKNPTRFQEPELVRVGHILVSTRDVERGRDMPPDQKMEKKKVAERILARAKAGEDFKLLVSLFSEDPVSKARGGEYTIARASADPDRAAVPEFEAAAFSLAVNQVSDLVTTRFGYHIIKLWEKIPPRPVDFAKVEPVIREKLLQDEVQKDLPAYIAQMKQAAGVQVFAGDTAR